MTNNNQSGRSMIEMLGVLAIIGVLSVGGIAGYSKAMMKFKINKTIDQISQIAQNVRVLYARQKNYGNLNTKIAYKANLAPREMFEDGSGSYSMTNPFGGYVELFSANSSTNSDNKSFVIGFHGLPDEACIELATQDWGSDTSSGLIAVGISAAGSGSFLKWIEGTSTGYDNGAGGGAVAVPNGTRLSTPLPIDVAVEACSGNNNLVSLKFK